MKETYVFVGSKAEVVGTPYVFHEFGQTVELEPAEAEMLVLQHGIHLIPQSDFSVAYQFGCMARFEVWVAFDKHQEYLRAKAAQPVTPAEVTTNE